ncbi:DNA cytosine methyltransferase [Bordetella genomosp. 11]|uniref:DNA (cytosine-5-)-methyltransferase n=1 Tax=Bordetella genomosp. 11 TaxID=1416808 RepID=A0A261UI21_9BORD|nr:DNA cytosine methyltransferase [Bordetella genomosp. 11]OZI61588.1 hypothetical protein CAL28_20105 [Bordetella genomosp. 11]
MIRDQFVLDVHPEIIVDNFAGGGGASTGIEMALGRCVDIAINHDPEAVAMHEINHPQTRHYCESVWDVDPLEATEGRPVGLAWFSPDCKHFSKAKGGKPRDKRIRGLAWIVLRWAALVRPRVIMLENVEEFRTWGPLLENGQPCPARKGKTFQSFIHQLQEKGYAVEHRELRACDYGAPTIRKRLFLIARCDGQPIVWPEPTHGAPTSPEVLAGLRKPWRTAADCIDWSIPCPSIFERQRPLAEATLKRIARGIRRYVLEAAEPFIVKCNHTSNRTVYDCFRGSAIAEPLKTITASHGMGLVTPFLTEHANGSTQRNFDTGTPLRTQCAEVRGGHFAMVAPTLVQAGYGEAPGQAPRAPGLGKPLGTVVAGGIKHALVSAFLAKHYGGNYDGSGAPLDGPMHTATTVDHHAVVAASLMTNTTGHSGAAASSPVPTLTTGGHHAVVAAQLVGCGGRAGQSRPRDAGEPAQTLTSKADTCVVTSHLAKLRNNQFGQPTEEPMPTLTAGGGHVADVRAFLVKYYSEGGQDQDCRDPMHTIPTKDRIGLVTVAGQEYVIADIGMRMLEPHELYAAQGFPANYIIAPTVNGRRLPKHAQVRMCGNSVCPPLAAALVRANVPDLAAWTTKEAKQRRIAA